MDYISLLVIAAIAISIFLGYKTGINTGLFSIGFAYLIGAFLLNMETKEIINTWPISIFFVILSVSLFYNFAVVNGTLEKLAMHLLYASRKFPQLILLVIYFAATLTAGLGAGYFTILAFFAPITLLLCKKTNTNSLLGAIAVNYGALAGANFMISASGIIFRGLIADTGLESQAFSDATYIFGATFIMPIVVIIGMMLLSNRGKDNKHLEIEKPEQYNKKQKINLYLIFSMIAIVLIFPILHNILPKNETIAFINSKLDIGLVAMIFSVIAFLFKLGDQKEVIARVPWGTLIMISGVGMLIQVAIKAGTIDLLASFVSTNIPKFLVPYVLALIAAAMSFFSSTLGVVTPALFPIIPEIAAATNLSTTLLFTATVVGAQSSSISPFSSGGSLILGSISGEEERNKMFPRLLFKAVPLCVCAALITTFILTIVI
ncbi:Di-and tricarboxylate transporter [Anaerosphaera aminiphila DSM 21120]|uniref:Di-and tricarboxylate transporter n=1 Tax=Anaerosphaera aminiphila DSM 21120 TaxID=1120995 RepID=A0A1M5Q7K7_9FIRM|nr:SLC13 family permease [Anaerosphaera aminiphila]SHH09739.1 Di-and tricarboxylate transporter [Anaerosphaera aminiphila DSM 21120]